MDLGTQREIGALSAVAQPAGIAEAHAGDGAGRVDERAVGGEAGEYVRTGRLGPAAQPGNELRERDDEIAMVALLRRRGQADAAPLREEPEFVPLHRDAGRRWRPAPVRDQRVERNGVEHGT